MSTLTEQEVLEFGAAVRGGLARVWGSPKVAGEPQAGGELLASVWELAAAGKLPEHPGQFGRQLIEHAGESLRSENAPAGTNAES